MKTATIDEYIPYGTRHYGIRITYMGKELVSHVGDASTKAGFRDATKDVLKRMGFTHWKKPNSNTKYDIDKGIK